MMLCVCVPTDTRELAAASTVVVDMVAGDVEVALLSTWTCNGKHCLVVPPQTTDIQERNAYNTPNPNYTRYFWVHRVTGDVSYAPLFYAVAPFGALTYDHSSACMWSWTPSQMALCQYFVEDPSPCRCVSS